MNSKEDQIVQYILLRSDLKWNFGSLVAQACHASTATIVENINKDVVRNYTKDVDNMRKVVLSCPDETTLKNVSLELKSNNIPHKLWIEKPEGIPTCIATMEQI
ncbi:hypothetical protein FG386_001978 [Cryptosporidium ryanae]|uniref:uncharacterized protein n=1 Tax=Cryptosporidium ryanae TaxID=515981 RepID=UPI00351AAFC4|nr:hypothetical protein FG386_001978 [Cryptosporidium ryanae]